MRGIGRRTQAERDARTVEMVFAALAGAVLAAAAFVALSVPVLLGDAHGEARKGWLTGAVIAAAAVFCGRVALTLRRFEIRQRDADPEAEENGPPGTDAAGAAHGSGPGTGTSSRAGIGEATTTGAAAGRRGAADDVSATRVPRQRRPSGAAADPGSGPPREGPVPPDQPSQPGRTSPDS